MSTSNNEGFSGFVVGAVLGLGAGLAVTYIVGKRVLKSTLQEWNAERKAASPPRTEHLDLAEKALEEES